MITSTKLYFAELLNSPRRNELVKPAVMFLVNFVLWIVVSQIITDALKSNDPSKIVALTWASVINGFTFGTVMPPFIYLLESANNVKSGKSQSILKLATTMMTILMFACTVAIVAFFPDKSAIGDASNPALMTAASISMATLIVMTAVERRMTKTKVS